MSERGRSEPARAQAREKTQEVPLYAPAPPIETTPPRRRHRLRTAAIVGFTTLGALVGGVKAVDVFTSDREPLVSPEPGVTAPTAPPGEDVEPTIGPSPEPSRSPQQEDVLKIKDLPPNEDLLWAQRPAPLGILTEVGGVIDGVNWNSVYISGRFVETYQKPIEFEGKEVEGFFATFIVGKNDQGEAVTADFFLGRKNDTVPATSMSGRSIDVDPKPAGSYSYLPLTITASELSERLESTNEQHPYKYYALIMHDKIYNPPNCDQYPYCVFFNKMFDKFENENIRTINSLRSANYGEKNDLTPNINDAGFISLVFLTPDHPNI